MHNWLNSPTATRIIHGLRRQCLFANGGEILFGVPSTPWSSLRFTDFNADAAPLHSRYIWHFKTKRLSSLSSGRGSKKLLCWEVFGKEDFPPAVRVLFLEHRREEVSGEISANDSLCHAFQQLIRRCSMLNAVDLPLRAFPYDIRVALPARVLLLWCC
ncbi:hypothetical protein EYF80_019318 [Liparis tanakae]|uniref:Uncharacterized protein n=1 Tax=Liparis tanakae TaxID=230148 RepID=A0A4Z2HXZ4_9TELE|nr:hypothetical protein EYF80_019318 [Liparis tanakae]